MEEQLHYYPPDSDLDLSFTSTTTATTDRTYSARSSLTLSFNESRLSSTSTTTCSSSNIQNLNHRPHRENDPNWAAIMAAINLSPDKSLHLRHLKLLRLVGSGNLGRVFLCRLRDNDHANFALKVVDHHSLTSKKMTQVQTEAEILAGLDHPFLPTLYAHLEVSHYTCLLMDYCSNGDLHSLLRKQPNYRLPIDAVRFYAAEVLVALEYLHANGIVYRDLKPENILIRDDGHIMLSDFDLCFKSDVKPKLERREEKSESSSRRMKTCFRRSSSQRREKQMVTEFIAEPSSAFSRSCVGTHEYLAPELVNGDGHGNGVDWWAFGVLIYELLYGVTPFKGSSKESTLRNIATTGGVKPRFQRREEEDNNGNGNGMLGDLACRDLIEKLLEKDPSKRLGCAKGATDIKKHPFFKGVKWPLIRGYRPPELRGLTVVKNSKRKTHMRHVAGNGMTSPRPRRGRHYLWNLLRFKVSKHIVNSNQNYYSHVTSTRSKC